MKWIACKVVFEGEAPAVIEDLVAASFADEGISGVSIDQPDLEPEEGWGDDALPKPEHHGVTGYLPMGEDSEEKILRLEKSLTALAAEEGFRFRIQRAEIDEEDWAESWKAFFWPEKIGNRIVIKPTWREYEKKENDLILEIDPGMAFGTGTHPTTSLCIRMIEKYVKPGDFVLDVGMGSGILLMAAGALGAGKLVGVDNDPVAVDVAGENLQRNGFTSERCELLLGNLAERVQGDFDLVVANILAEVVVELIPDMGRVLKPGGILILSGIIEEKMPDVLSALREENFASLENLVDRGWVACVARA